MKLLLGALLALVSASSAQEPPPPEGEEQDQQQEEQGPLPEPGTEAPPAGEESRPSEVASGEATPAAPDGSPSSVAPSPAPAHPPVAWPLTSDAIALHLRGIAGTHPDVAALEVIGRSTQGREILALRLSAREPGGQTPGSPLVARPVLLLADYQGQGSAGPEACLELAWQLAESFRSDEPVRRLLSGAELVVAPALDPDARQGTARSSAVEYDRNFPSGWQPETLSPGAGRVSLSLPEALASARFLAGLRTCAVVLGFAAPAPRSQPYPSAELPDTDRIVFDGLSAALTLEGASALVPWYERGSPGGGFFDFAYQARGIYPLLIPVPAEEELAAGALGEFTRGVTTRVLRCLALLPRVELAQEGLERLAPNTWKLDIRIQNGGVVPTLSALARQREAGADVSLMLTGAKLVALARKPVGAADYTDPSFQVRTPLAGGTLAGGEGRWLRLFLEASSGAEVEVTAGSQWAGSARTRVTLP